MPTLVGGALRVARTLRLMAKPSSPGATPLAARGPAAPAGLDPDGLTSWQVAKSAVRLAALRPDDRRVIQAALAAAQPAARGPLRRAVAAGLSTSELIVLATGLAEKSADWITEHVSLVDDELGRQYRRGEPVDQVDGTTCGTTVLIVLAANADPRRALETTAADGLRAFDALQFLVHRQSTRLWPQALGTTPWGMVAWLRRHAAGVGPYRVRLVDDANPRDVGALISEVAAALERGDPVPLLVGAAVPRHYVLATGREEGGWRVYEPGSGEVRLVDPAAIREHRLAPVLGFDHLHAALLPGC